MDVVETSCPAAETLADFTAGRLGDDEMARVAAHLETCPHCLKALESPSSRDNFVANLQRIHQEGVTQWSATMTPAANAELESGPYFFNISHEPATKDVDAFFAALAESRLFDERELTALQSEYRAFRSADVAEFGQTLVLEEQLTEFQCRQLLRGKTRGWVLGEYVILHPLGAGGMGWVYRAWHRRMKRMVALKITPPHLSRSAANVKRFQREIEAVAQLRHPRLITALDAGEADGVCYLVMEELHGHSLAEWVELNGPMRILAAVDMIRQAAEGLAVAHQAGIVHRDVKPSNIWVEVFSGSMRSPNVPGVKVLDFGLAHVAEIESSRSGKPLTGSQQILGAVGFMAPEQARDSHAADERADIYGLGCTLYFLLTGKPPYDGASSLDAFAKQLEAPIPALQSPKEKVPFRLERIYRKMVAKSPDNRYDSMDDLIEDLDEYLAGAPRRWPAWAPWAALAAAALLVVGLGVMFWPTGAAIDPPILAKSKPPEPLRGPASEEEAAAAQKAWAAHLGVPVEWTHPAGIAFRLIPPGAVTLGTPDGEIDERMKQWAPGWQRDYLRREGIKEWPLRPITIEKPFYLGRTEVTVGQFRAFASAVPHTTSAETEGGVSHAKGLFRRKGFEWTWRTPGFADMTEEDPVVEVSEGDARAYCKWLATSDHRIYRLPTETEWEYACRGGTETRWFWGKDADRSRDYAATPVDRRYGPHPVAQKRPNPFGLFDMSGNVAEWTSDRFEPANAKMAIRGGSFLQPIPDGCASASRLPAPDPAQDFVGFRVLLELPEKAGR